LKSVGQISPPKVRQNQNPNLKETPPPRKIATVNSLIFLEKNWRLMCLGWH